MFIYSLKLILISSYILSQQMRNRHGALVTIRVSRFDSDKYFSFEFLLEVHSNVPATICSESYYFKCKVLWNFLVMVTQRIDSAIRIGSPEIESRP